jgi:hypothetical protein
MFRIWNTGFDDNLSQFLSHQNMLIIIEGQVHLVCLLTDNFSLFLCQKKDKRQTSVCTISQLKWIKEDHLGFRLPVDVYISTSTYPCLCEPGIWQTELMENANFHLFAANGNDRCVEASETRGTTALVY